MSTLATPEDLSLYLGSPANFDSARAQLLLDLAEGEASAVVAPLPLAAKSVILRVTARAYPNPDGVQSSSVGSVSATFGSPGGLYLNRYDRRDIERMAGIGGGAFTINPAPNAGEDYRDPLMTPTLEDIEQFTYDYPGLIDEP